MTDDGFQERMNELISRVGTVAELARKSHLSRRIIDNYKAGAADPSRARLIALADAAGVSVGWLATGEGVPCPGETVPPEGSSRRGKPWGNPDEDGSANSDALWEKQAGEELYGQATEAFAEVYRSAGYNTPLRDIANHAARVAKTIEAAGGTPDQQQFALRVAVDQLRLDLRRGLADPTSTLANKSRA